MEHEATLARVRAKLPKWQLQFIEAFTAALRKRPIITEALNEACAAAGRGISSKTAYIWREKDRAFRDAWDEALEAGWDRAEGAAYTRGVEGVEVPVINMKTGEIMGHKTEYSDRLLELLLKGNRAQKYKDRSQVDIGPSDSMVEFLAGLRQPGVPKIREGGEQEGASEA